MKQNELTFAAILAVVKGHTKGLYTMVHVSISDLNMVIAEDYWKRWRLTIEDILKKRGGYILDDVFDLEEQHGITVFTHHWEGNHNDMIDECRSVQFRGDFHLNLLPVVPAYLYTQAPDHIFRDLSVEHVYYVYPDDNWLMIIHFLIDEKSMIGKQYKAGREAWEAATFKD